MRRWCAAAFAVLVGGSPVADGREINGHELEEIIVTGLRILRRDFESASPIVTIDAESFEHTGAISVESVLSKLPQLELAFGSTSNNPGNGGQGNIQLRGLGLTSTPRSRRRACTPHPTDPGCRSDWASLAQASVRTSGAPCGMPAR